jgi:hypothetical protein
MVLKSVWNKETKKYVCNDAPSKEIEAAINGMATGFSKIKLHGKMNGRTLIVDGGSASGKDLTPADIENMWFTAGEPKAIKVSQKINA